MAKYELNQQKEAKKTDRTLRMVFLFIGIGVLNQIEQHPESIPSFLKSSDAMVSAVSFLTIYGQAVLSLWFLYELIAAISRRFKRPDKVVAKQTAPVNEKAKDSLTHTFVDQEKSNTPSALRLAASKHPTKAAEATIPSKLVMILVVVASLLLLGTGTWYFAVRPQQVRKDCNAIGIKHAEAAHSYQDKVYDLNYTACLHRHGM